MEKKIGFMVVEVSMGHVEFEYQPLEVFESKANAELFMAHKRINTLSPSRGGMIYRIDEIPLTLVKQQNNR